MDWLTTEQHEELRLLVVSNDSTARKIRTLLAGDRERLLVALDRALARLTIEDPILAPVATRVVGQSRLSDQAMSLLRAFATRGSTLVGRPLEL